MRKLFCLIGLCVALVAYSAPITPDEASRIAAQWMGDKSCVGRRATISNNRNMNAESTVNQPLYVYNFSDNNGWVLVAGDDRARAMVLGYSETGSFDYDQLCDAEKAWIDSYVEQINSLDEQDEEFFQDDEPLSRKLVTPVVTPMLTTAWKQGAPYNTLCPTMRDSATLVGCVALAWAMVCKYMEYPSSASFSYDYIWAKNDSIRRSGTVSSTYNYSLMPNQLTTTSDSQKINAVARLCADIGSAVQMNYGISSSGCTPRFAAGRMVEKFGLDQGMINHYRNYYSDADWDAMLMSELDAGRPIIYSGWKTSGGGHTFVCDGYNTNGYFHFNYGHGSVNSTAYYKSSAVKDNYNKNQEAVTHIMASHSSQLPGVDATYNGNLSVNTSKMQFTIDAKVHFSVMQPCLIYNTICCEDITTGQKFYGKEKDINCKTSNDWSYTSESVTYELPILTRAKMPSGTYRCYPVFRVTLGDVSGEWKRFYFPTDDYVSELCIKKNGAQYTVVDCPQTPTDIENTRSEGNVCNKFLRNGCLILHYNGLEYNILGAPTTR